MRDKPIDIKNGSSCVTLEMRQPGLRLSRKARFFETKTKTDSE